MPTHSRTASAPTPPVISLTAWPPSLPRSATTWVAPNSVAIFCRGSCRDIAMIVSAPSTDAARTPHRPTAPSPTTTAVPPFADAGGHRRVPAGGHHVGEGEQRREQVAVRDAVRPHQAAVGLADARVLRLAARCHGRVRRRRTGTRPGSAGRCCRSGRTARSRSRRARSPAPRRPTSSTTPMHSCPIVFPGVMSFSPRYGQRSEPQMQAAVTFTIGVGRGLDRGVATRRRRGCHGGRGWSWRACPPSLRRGRIALSHM